MKNCSSCKGIKPFSEFYRHPTKPDGKDHRCISCQKTYMADWRKRNKQHISNYDRTKRQKDGDAIRKRRRELYALHSAKERDRAKKQRDQYPERIRGIGKRFRKKNLKKLTEKNRRRRALKKGLSVEKVPKTTELLAKQGGMCASCKCKGSDVKWHMDHIIPLSKGGGHVKDNVQILCAPCNLKKGNMTPEKWALINGRFF